MKVFEQPVTVRADLRRRVAELGDVLEAGRHRLANGCSAVVTSITSVTSLGAGSRDEGAKTALDGWFHGGPSASAPTTTTTTTTTITAREKLTRRFSKTNPTPNQNKQKHNGNNKQRGTSKEELGTATWTFLHTLAAQYPDRPSSRQKRDARNLIDIMTRLYPCGECAEHFQEIVRASPPDVGSRSGLTQWMCDVHNAVNRSLDKPVFNCDFVRGRWPGLEDEDGRGCSGDDRESKGCALRNY